MEGATAADSSKEVELEQCLEGAIETLRQLVIIVEEFKRDSQPLLCDKTNAVIDMLQRLENIRFNYDMEVPLEVFKHIDEGENPDLYLQQTLRTCMESNERTKGKIEALQNFKQALEDEIKSVYPNELAIYKSLSEEEGPTIKEEPTHNHYG
ncbi:hypothetical protein QOT17_012779 [Balamuthia mandrillaris]